VVPEVETAAGPSARAKPVDEPGSYVLQAGSFGAAGEADKLRANLALLGIESRVQRVTIDDDVYHRVRIGPISDLEKLNRIRRQLRDAHINAMLMKVPP
jgi:cell division protein FtsN